MGGAGGVSGSSEDSDIEDDWVERYVVYKNKSFLVRASYLEMTEVVLSKAY